MQKCISIYREQNENKERKMKKKNIQISTFDVIGDELYVKKMNKKCKKGNRDKRKRNNI